MNQFQQRTHSQELTYFAALCRLAELVPYWLRGAGIHRVLEYKILVEQR